jgi:DNA-binding response OmpR family regulator
VLKQIRATQEYRILPVIMLTSSTMEADIVRCYESGANGYVVKPTDFNEFIEYIKGIGYFWININILPDKR